MTKVCIKCEIEKDEVDFPFNRYGDRQLRRNSCRDCLNAARKNHEHDEKPKGLACRKCGEYKPIAFFPMQRQCLYGVEPVCKACKLKHRQDYVALYPDRARNADLKYLYGLTLDEFNAMVEAQAGQCAICGTAEEKLVVDHNHTTGRVRSLLCHLCNAMIGCARESSEILVRAAAYLHAEQHPELGRVRADVTYVKVEMAKGVTAVTAVTAASAVTLGQQRLAL
jgi:hypothetical protein